MCVCMYVCVCACVYVCVCVCVSVCVCANILFEDNNTHVSVIFSENSRYALILNYFLL